MFSLIVGEEICIHLKKFRGKLLRSNYSTKHNPTYWWQRNALFPGLKEYHVIFGYKLFRAETMMRMFLTYPVGQEQNGWALRIRLKLPGHWAWQHRLRKDVKTKGRCKLYQSQNANRAERIDEKRPDDGRPRVNPEMLGLARDYLGMTQAGLAARLSFTQTTLSRYEAGILDVPDNHLVEIARVLNRPLSFFSATIASMRRAAITTASERSCRQKIESAFMAGQ